MKKVRLTDLDDQESFFHFSPAAAISSVEEKGLEARIGNHSKAGEKTEKIFFSKGIIGALEACDVWIKWMMNNGYSEKDSYGLYHGKTLEERKNSIETWNKEFLSREYLKDSAKQRIIFNLVYESLKKQVYYKLDLIEGVDFNYNDIDEIKERTALKKDQGDFSHYIYQKEMYGYFSDVDSLVMDQWNIHTKANKGVEKEKISQVVSSTGAEDGLSIVQEMYEMQGKDRQWNNIYRVYI